MMSKWRIILTALAVVVMVGGGQALRQRVSRPQLELSSLGEAFSGNVALPKETIQARVAAPDQPAPKPPAAMGFRVMIVMVGLLSAASSVATAGAHKFREGEAAELDTAKKVQDLVNQARRDVQSAKDAREAQAILDAMQDALALLP
jgi:hypothetical protein